MRLTGVERFTGSPSMMDIGIRSPADCGASGVAGVAVWRRGRGVWQRISPDAARWSNQESWTNAREQRPVARPAADFPTNGPAACRRARFDGNRYIDARLRQLLGSFTASRAPAPVQESDSQPPLLTHPSRPQNGPGTISPAQTIPGNLSYRSTTVYREKWRTQEFAPQLRVCYDEIASQWTVSCRTGPPIPHGVNSAQRELYRLSWQSSCLGDR
jgi:hypothetical protein